MSQQGIILPLPTWNIHAGLSKEQIATANREFLAFALSVAAAFFGIVTVVFVVEGIIK